MLNICARCGAYRADKIIDPDGPYAICPSCGHQERFRRLPLLIVGGASGTGKSAVCRALLGRMEEVVLLEGDMLWRPEFVSPEDGYRGFFETWLRVAKNVAQSGRPVVLFGAGMGVPTNIESCVERRYFARVHYFALVCDADTLAQRLRARPAWRNSDDAAWIDGQIRFNRWFSENSGGDPPITLLDTSALPVQAAALQLAAWIRAIVASVAKD